ncbi:cysteine synthase A [Parahaliea aestuarii]|uniref:cysteine synthase n=1 Tax=Parahaliea aestuarii TaxID=1852021 RepID=A0A5C8ZNP7_9GAMM|nr:cysteine synthase A [Parahaliea aestuarii]TXS89187.1 cysteine synthase A [Parahaliea aestuarii]
MTQQTGIADLIGNTPLLYLREASELTGCQIYGKAEFMNPGGSIKDRTALGIVRAAQASGELRPGGVIVEGTAGNTGIGLTLVANALGYQSVIVMPQTASPEKINQLEMLGADLILVPNAPYSSSQHYIHTACKVAEGRAHSEPNGAIWAQQFDNPANRQVHRDTTGQEIWRQTSGDVDGFICAVGTGGTLAGVADALRAHKPSVKIGLVDPAGSALFSHFNGGPLQGEGQSIAEGIGVSFVPGNLEGLALDFSCQIDDDTALPFAFNLLKREGISVGGSSGINIAGAVALARELGPGHTIVTILCDAGSRYHSKLFNPEFLMRHKLPFPEWMAS